MAFKLFCLAIVLGCMVKPNHGHTVFDVTNFGAVSDGQADSSDAFVAAWKSACQTGQQATMLVPSGTYLIERPVSFSGPCGGDGNAAPTVDIRGVLMAAPSPAGFGQKVVGWIEFRDLNGLHLTGGGSGILDGNGAEAWDLAHRGINKPVNQRAITLRFIHVYDSTIDGFTLKNSKGFQMAIHESRGITVNDFHISAPPSSPNTDGLHISRSTSVQISNFFIGTGDDCISIGPGCVNVNISGITCNPGHGISIGSLGEKADEPEVAGIIIRDSKISNADNGVRIKTWPNMNAGVARDITFDNIVMRNVSRPILIDQSYCANGKGCPENMASGVQLSNVLFRNIRGTSSKKQAVTIICSPSQPCRDVRLEKIRLRHMDKKTGKYQHAEFCSNDMDGDFGEMRPVPCTRNN